MILILVRNVFRYVDLDTDSELLWIELCTNKASVLFGVAYQPSGSSVNYLEEMHNSLLCAVNKNIPVLICGDFNLPNIDWSVVSPSPSTPVAAAFSDIISDFSQLVTFPSHKDNILDLVLTIHPDLVSSISLCDSLPGTDHDAVSFSVTTVSPSLSRFCISIKT